MFAKITAMNSTSPTLIYRLANHDSLNGNSRTKAKFESYTLEEYNEEFGTDFTSVMEAVEADPDPEYLFTEEDVREWRKMEEWEGL
jgi:leucyl-tRNA synthetase